MENYNLIEIGWEGPFDLEEVKSFNKREDYGVYQIYGTHNIFGTDSLLYIGKANQQNFATRLLQHEWWLNTEYSEIKLFIGRIGGTKDIDFNDWELRIDLAEKLLIFYCSPPYNTQNINGYGEIEHHTIVLNLGKKNKIPLEVSTLWEESPYWGHEWEYYKSK